MHLGELRDGTCILTQPVSDRWEVPLWAVYVPQCQSTTGRAPEGPAFPLDRAWGL